MDLAFNDSAPLDVSTAPDGHFVLTNTTWGSFTFEAQCLDSTTGISIG